ncbi:MAG TPA: cyclodeaminase/cyclohydrolase family protein [Thermomicrobiaceae bacterium]|nr:cyclodeaminase/cyclohydrolase family protein [Thermomicrobiaceae bacterium]
MPEENPAGEQGLADQTIRWVAEQVANPAHHSGGAAAAALALAGAAASAELVLRLAVGRKANIDRREALEADIRHLRQLRDECLAAADHDLAAFEQVLLAQQARKAGEPGAGERLQQALLTAAASPLTMAERGLDLIQIVARQLPVGTRFTISDLGAAAALARGAIDAAYLTVLANLATTGEPGAEQRRRAERARLEATRLEAEIQRGTRERIAG